MEPIAFMLLGLGAGALYGALAQGLVLAYRGAGVVNFSHGAVTMFVAYVYSELRRTGRLVVLPLPNPLALVEGVANRFFGGHLDLPDWPTTIGVGGPTVLPLAIGVALLYGAFLGLAVHLFVFRPMRHAPPLAKVVAAVGIMIVLQSTATLRFGSDSRNVPSILPNSGFEFGGVVVGLDRLILAAIALAIGICLTVVMRRTMFGLATVAAAENERGAIVLGHSPDFLAGVSWVLSMVLAGVVGILAAPITTLNPTNFTLFVIPALAAALIGGFSSFIVAAVAGLGLGMADQLVQWLSTKPATDWLPRGSREFVPFAAIALTLTLRGTTLPTRGAVTVDRLPAAPSPRRPVLWIAVFSAIVFAGLVTLDYDWRQAIGTTLIGVMLAASLVVITGFVGQISLAQIAIAGFAAFALVTLSGRWDVPFPVAPVLAVAAATALGTLVGLPAMRVRGVHLALVTLALALVLDRMVFNNNELTTIAGVALQADQPRLFGVGLGPFDPFFLGDDKIPSPVFGVGVLVIAAFVCLAVANLRRSATGRRMLAVRSNERAAAAAGVSVMQTKLLAFATSSFIAGIGGVLLAYQAGGRLSPQGFAALQSLNVLAVAYLGGITSLGGATVAGITILGGVATVLFDKVVHIGPWQELGGGLGLVFVAVVHPSGMAGALRNGSDRVRALLAPFTRRGVPEPAAGPAGEYVRSST